MSKRFRRWLGLALALDIVSFIAASIALGGDALTGKAANGHYYFASGGEYVEVSRGLFIYSTIHAYCALFGLIALVWLGRFARVRKK